MSVDPSDRAFCTTKVKTTLELVVDRNRTQEKNPRAKGNKEKGRVRSTSFAAIPFPKQGAGGAGGRIVGMRAA